MSRQEAINFLNKVGNGQKKANYRRNKKKAAQPFACACCGSNQPTWARMCRGHLFKIRPNGEPRCEGATRIYRIHDKDVTPGSYGEMWRSKTRPGTYVVMYAGAWMPEHMLHKDVLKRTEMIDGAVSAYVWPKGEITGQWMKASDAIRMYYNKQLNELSGCDIPRKIWNVGRVTRANIRAESCQEMIDG